MITRVEYVNGHWFAYTAERVLGPFKSERRAWAAAREEARS